MFQFQFVAELGMIPNISLEAYSERTVVFQFLRPVLIDSISLPLCLTVLLSALVIPVTRFLFSRLLFQPIGSIFLPKEAANGSEKKPSSGKKNNTVTLSDKWEAACWSFLFYITVTIFNFFVVSSERWFTKPARLWYDCSQIPCEYSVSDGLLWLYAIQLGYYTQSIPSMIIFDFKRKDFYQMIIHHLATIGLIVYSIGTNFVRAGAMILLAHDVCDVFMEAAKMFRYLNYNDASTVIFAIFVIVWILMRVIYLPLCLIRSCMWDTLGYLAVPFDIPPEPHYVFLNGLLSLLYCIHLYWTYLILKIVWSVVVLNQEVDDVREEEEEEKKEYKKKQN